MQASLLDNESFRLEALHRYQILDTDAEQAFDDLAHLAAQICQTPIALISLVDRERQWFKSKVGLAISETHRDLAFCAHAILHDELLIIPDAKVDERFVTNPLVAHEPNFRFYAGAPLLAPDGYRLGTLCVLDYVPRQLQAKQIESLQALSRQVVHLLELRRNLEEHQQIAKERDRFFDLSLDMICTAALDGYFIRLNPAWQRTLGYSIEELKRTPFIDFVHPDDRAATLAEFEQLVRGSITTHFENRYRCHDGSYKWIAWTAVPVVESGMVYAIARDVTEHKQAEETLRQQAERERIVREVAQRIRQSLDLDEILNTTVVEIRNLLQTDRVFIYQFYPDWSGTIAFESVDQAWHSALDQMVDDPFFKQSEGRLLYEQGRIQAIPDIYTAGLTHCHLQLLEQFQIRANLVVPILQEERLWGLLVANHCSAPRSWQAWEIELLKQLSTQVAIAIQQSQLYQQVQLELLERKRAEQKNQEQAALLDVATDAIFVKDLQHQILYWNKGAEQLYGWTVKEACGKDADELLHHKTLAIAEIHQVTLTMGEWHGELQQTAKDGKELIVESRWTLVLDEVEQPKSILVVNTDITQKKLLEQQFLRSQRMESIGTLASGIAHDINNILAPILMAVQLLRIKHSEEQGNQWLEILEMSARRGSDLIKQVLSFARGMDGEYGILQIRHLITEIKQIAEETFPKSIQIYTYIPRELWTVSGDATHLHQVLMNLCVNARDGMPDGGTLSIRAKNLVIDEAKAQCHLDARVGAYVAISVTDTGIGIPADLLDRIFDPFFTTKEINKGTGLGLATVMGIVRSHHGFITVSSQIGRGTEFQVFLPAVNTEESPSIDETELLIGHGERILIVDDEASIREMAKDLLQTYGYQVLTANNGIEAIALYAQHQTKIHLVFIDLMMPEMDGATAIRTLQKINPNIKIITSSGLLSEVELSSVNKSSILPFIPKPYTSQEMLRIIHDELEKQ